MELAYKKPLWDHQRREINSHWMCRNRMFLWWPRTGKSLAVIASASYQYLAGNFKHLLIIAPSTVHENWGLEEFPAHCVVPYKCFTWSSQEMTTKRGQRAWDYFYNDKGQHLKVFSVNREALMVPRAIERIRQFTCLHRCGLVVDEVHHFGEPGARTTKRLCSLSKHAVWRRILTGTPMQNSPLKFYSISNMLEHGILGYNRADDFRAQYADYEIVNMGRGRVRLQVRGYKNLDDLMRRLVPFTSLVSRTDLSGLPDLIESNRVFCLTPSQRSRYDECYAEVKEKAKKGNRMAFGAAVSKLIGISSNVDHLHEPNPRLNALLSIIQESDPSEKCIIWCNYVKEIEHLVSVFQGSCVTYYGDTPHNQREANIHRFRNDPSCRFFIANPQAIGEGRNLSAASFVIWYSLTFDNLLYTQAAERASLLGKKDVTIFRLVADKTIDSTIEKNLNAKDRRVSDTLAILEKLLAR